MCTTLVAWVRQTTRHRPSRSGHSPVTVGRQSRQPAGLRVSRPSKVAAGVQVAGRAAGLKPLLALRCRAVGERLGIDPALGLLLDAVVADRRRRVLSAWSSSASLIGHVARFVGQPAPHARIAVGLQLECDRELVLLARVGTAARPDLALGAEQRLQVVPGLVGQDVRLRVTALSAELLLQLVEEADVDVDALVRRAVEGPDLRGRLAAAGVDRVGEEGQRRLRGTSRRAARTPRPRPR